LSGTVSLNPGVGPKVESSFMDELRKVYEKGFTAAEVDGAKKALLDARMVGRSTDGALLNLMVSHEQLGRPLKWDADLEAKIQALTVDQVNAAFRKHIDPSGVSIVKAGTSKRQASTDSQGPPHPHVPRNCLYVSPFRWDTRCHATVFRQARRCFADPDSSGPGGRSRDQ
jgi:hypothetical protein